MIAALYVERGGVYWDLPGVDPWDARRDARLYNGPWPVVAHPPCSTWCRLAGFVQARYGKPKWEDGGCFAAALAAVRRFGGVLEHPAYSDAWKAHGLNAPPTGGGWVNADFFGGWTCYIEQFRYGHPAKKATWLYANGVELPSLRWGLLSDNESDFLVSWCGNHARKRFQVSRIWAGRQARCSGDERPRLGKGKAQKTPIEFRDVLLGMARSALPSAVSSDST